MSGEEGMEIRVKEVDEERVGVSSEKDRRMVRR
jgi:hypothetical protein